MTTEGKKLSKAQREAKPRFGLPSFRILCEIADYSRRYRGPNESDASDVCDGSYDRDELDELIKKRFLRIIRDGDGLLPGDVPPHRLCGRGWTVHLTSPAIKLLTPLGRKEANRG